MKKRKLDLDIKEKKIGSYRNIQREIEGSLRLSIVKKLKTHKNMNTKADLAIPGIVLFIKRE